MKRKFRAVLSNEITAATKRNLRRSITAATYNGFDESEFDEDQLQQIREGLEEGLDISWYADPKYYYSEMRYIRFGLEEGLDVSIYADPKFDDGQMYEIFVGLLHGLDVSTYADPKFNNAQMRMIRYGLEDGIDVSQYADPKYTAGQMERIVRAARRRTRGATNQWASIKSELESEQEDGIDSIYEGTHAGEYLTNVQKEVEDSLDVWLEPSVQAGVGSIYFYSTEDDSDVGQPYDYQDFNMDIIELALDSATKAEYKKRYKSYLESIINR